ncbi:MAG: hypothetical protein WAR01_07190 [Dokdonella sp.]|nr:hypothetical protein [Dokdonella sp.]HQX65226.1 hypothetical protein [Dokdonella sp.]
MTRPGGNFDECRRRRVGDRVKGKFQGRIRRQALQGNVQRAAAAGHGTSASSMRRTGPAKGADAIRHSDDEALICRRSATRIAHLDDKVGAACG